MNRCLADEKITFTHVQSEYHSWMQSIKDFVKNNVQPNIIIHSNNTFDIYHDDVKSTAFISLFIDSLEPTIIKDILTNGINPALLSLPQLQPKLLQQAIMNNNQAQLEQILFENPNHIYSRTDDGETLLHLAISHGKVDIVKFLIAQGAEINVFDNKGYSPLYLILAQHKAQSRQLLLDLAAYFQPKAQNPQPLLDLAAYLIDQIKPEQVTPGQIVSIQAKAHKSSLDRLLADLYLHPDTTAISEAVGQWLGIPELDKYYTNQDYRDIYRLHRNNFISINAERGEIASDGNDMDIFVGFKLRLYVEILIKLEKGWVLSSELPADINSSATIAKLRSEILINAQMWWNEKLRFAYANINNANYQNQFKIKHAEAIINHLQALAVGEEHYLYSGYMTNKEAHCIYVALSKQADNKILVRIDNRWLDSRRIDGKLHKTSIVNNVEIIRPHCVGIIDINSNALKVYIIGVIDALFSADATTAMNMLYDKDNKLPKPKDIRFIEAWPAQDKQPGNATNCTMSSHNFGIMCRQGVKFAKWLENQENSLIWQNLDQQTITAGTSTASVARPARAAGNICSTGAQLSLPSQLRSSISTPPPVPSHEQLMRHLAQKLNVTYEEVMNGSTVEQTLVGMAGISTNQRKACFRRNSYRATYFVLYFNNQDEVNKFINYYDNSFPGFIQPGVEVKLDNNSLKIIVDTRYLFNTITPAMAEYLNPNV